MFKIITTAEAQKSIGTISKEIESTGVIVTSHGKGKMVILPYFDGCDQHISNYQEDFLMNTRKDLLQERYKSSSKSGKSDLVI